MKKKMSLFVVLLLFMCILTSAVGPACRASAESSKRQEYTKRYKKLNKKCKKKFKNDLPQVQLNLNAEEEYKLWDKELNYIYNDIIQQLDEDQKNQLIQSELKWIVRRDQKVKAESDVYVQGSIYPLIYYRSLTKYTKKRIRWLINHYTD